MAPKGVGNTVDMVWAEPLFMNDLTTTHTPDIVSENGTFGHDHWYANRRQMTTNKCLLTAKPVPTKCGISGLALP
jgi:hypothetical protein